MRTMRLRVCAYGHIGAQGAYHEAHYCCPVCSAAEGAWHRSWCGNVNPLSGDNVVRRPEPIDRAPTRMMLTDAAHEADARKLLEREALARRSLFAPVGRSLSDIERSIVEYMRPA